MFCPSCGEEIADDSAFCRYCGETLEPDRERTREPTTEGHEIELEPEESETSTIKKLGYWGGRIVQLVLVALAVIFVVGSLMENANVIQFAAIGVLALVLLGFAGVIEVIIVRPSSR